MFMHFPQKCVQADESIIYLSKGLRLEFQFAGTLFGSLLANILKPKKIDVLDEIRFWWGKKVLIHYRCDIFLYIF